MNKPKYLYKTEDKFTIFEFISVWDLKAVLRKWLSIQKLQQKMFTI
jgi:hypothetical protein